MRKKMSDINILGTNYKFEIVEEKSEKLDGSDGGITKYFEKKIYVNGDNEEISDLNRVIRHEIIHAFLYESGLPEYSHDEKIVDWLAMQIPKIVKIYEPLEKQEDDKQ